MYAPLSPKTEIEVVSAKTAIEDEVIRIAVAGKYSIISRGHPEWVHGECSDKTNLSGILRDLKEKGADSDFVRDVLGSLFSSVNPFSEAAIDGFVAPFRALAW
ncbi:hypothetical protein CASFOL_009587 [Castilleja foliolosa]|uniref:Uncharacterized protein n=1 Tax=Castilleja foliolosa TaxID=1961234 RepID=A0ABD3DWI6_9LAMI